jgi:PDZ domain-containing protein
MMQRIPYLVVPVAALLIALSEVSLPYYAEGPGPAKDVEPLIHVSGRQVFSSEGKFVLTSVSGSPVNLFQFIGAWLNPTKSLVPETLFVLPGETQQQATDRALSDMDESKLDAAYVVLSRLAGYPKKHGRGVLVETVFDGCPAAGRLFVGDLVLAVDGSAVSSEADFERLLGRIPNGQAIHLTGRAGGRPFSATVTRRPCSGSRRPLIGISTIANFPFHVSISSGDIGGPSAGLMWALGLYDLLTPGDLTSDRVVAGTGEIELDGTVGPIGGVQEKIAAARASGATVFLVPQGNLAEARPAAQGITLVPVRTLQQALHDLQAAR